MKTRQSALLTILGLFGCRGSEWNPSLQGLAQLQHSELAWGGVGPWHAQLPWKKAAVRFWPKTQLPIPNMLSKSVFLKACYTDCWSLGVDVDCVT